MEDEHDIEDREFFASDGEGKTDEDRVEYYAKFEDCNRSDLCGVGVGVEGPGGGLRLS